MINSKRVFKAGFCSILGSVIFSIAFWNGYMTDTGRYLIWNEFDGHSPFLMFAMYLMPLLIGLPAGFSMIFYSIYLEGKEAQQEFENRAAARAVLLERKDLTSLERIDIFLGGKEPNL